MKQQKLEFNFLIFRTAFGQYPDGSDFRRKKKEFDSLISHLNSFTLFKMSSTVYKFTT